MKALLLALLLCAAVFPAMAQTQKKQVKVFVPPPKRAKVFVPPTQPAKVFVPPAKQVNVFVPPAQFGKAFTTTLVPPADAALPSSVVPDASTNVSQLNPAQFQPRGYGLGRTDQDRPGRSLYRWSVAAVLAANGADALSSWRQQEGNMLVAGPGTQFGGASIAIKSGFVGTSLIIQHIVLRHRPDLYKKLAWLNFGTAGALGAVVVHNVQIQ